MGQINWVTCHSCGNAVAKSSVQCPTCNANVFKYYKEKEEQREEQQSKNTYWLFLIIVPLSLSLTIYDTFDELLLKKLMISIGISKHLTLFILLIACGSSLYASYSICKKKNNIPLILEIFNVILYISNICNICINRIWYKFNI